jgi:RelA/SpoT family (p)ppGpp synthetase
MLLYPVKEIKKLKPPKYGVGEAADFQAFIEFCKQFSSNVNISLLHKAYEFNVEVNRNLFRKSGEQFYTHPLEVASFLVENIMYNDELIASALLHDVIGKNEMFDINDIESEFGEIIAQIVDNVHRITSLERRNLNDIEYFRRLILALTTDVRIIFIKIADRFIDMKTISYLRGETQQKFAEDTFQVYVPLAHRFGFYAIKSELEDMAFRVLDKSNYDRIVRKLKMTKRECDEYLRKFSAPIIQMLQNLPVLKDNNIYFEVHGRVKHIYSIYNKTLLRGKPVDELYDIIGIRIILDTEDESICEKVMNEIKNIYKYIPETYKDYIRNPKPNGYKSIHCAFIGKDEQKVEVQVRTLNMHLIAERGIAAHYRYKSGLVSVDSVFDDQQIEQWIQEIRRMLANKEEVPVEKLLESFKYDIFSNEIYVFTPTHEIKILPKNATVLDFAYYIHTDVGNRCAGAKVNGRTSNLFTQLQNGDVVEIITASNLEPELTWLNKVVTSKAKNAILKYFTKKIRKQYREGNKFFEKLLDEVDLLSNKVKLLNLCLKFFNFSNSREFYIELGKSVELRNAVDFFIHFLKENDLKIDEKMLNNYPILKKVVEISEKRRNLDPNVHKIEMADCCLPVRGDSVVAYLSDNTVIVHRVDCKWMKYQVAGFAMRKIEFRWDYVNQPDFDIGLKFSASNNQFILDLMTQVLQGRDDCMIVSASKQETTPNNYFWRFYLKVRDNTIVDIIKKKIENSYLDVKVERVGKEQLS